MKSILLSSLTKVFKDVEPNFDEFKEFSVLRGEVFNFQIAVFPQIGRASCRERVSPDV